MEGRWAKFLPYPIHRILQQKIENSPPTGTLVRCPSGTSGGGWFSPSVCMLSCTHAHGNSLCENGASINRSVSGPWGPTFYSCGHIQNRTQNGVPALSLYCTLHNMKFLLPLLLERYGLPSQSSRFVVMPRPGKAGPRSTWNFGSCLMVGIDPHAVALGRPD